MTTTLLLGLAWKLLLPLLLVVALVDVLTQTQPQRIKRLSSAGYSQRRIAERLNITRYRVRQALA
jgi:DNA-binding CsgD family transcriptional regulator